MANGANYIGQQIGNYRIEKELGGGGFGMVYLAKHTVLKNRFVAIKLLHAHLASQKERDQFLQEAELLEKLKHPHILPLLDVGLYNNVPYLVSEYAPQGSLRDRLDRGPKPLSVQEMVSILAQVGQSLQFAHDQNVIHRDIKPDNILFNAKGEALLADFGIATTLTTKSVQRATVVGTFDYMAPEQFQGTVSKESDQYALGCLAYELATGQHPFNTADIAVIIAMHLNQTPTNPTQLNPQLPTHIAQAILKALAKQRADRHANVTAFIAALQAAGNPKAQPQKPAPNAAPPTPAQALPPTVPVRPAPVARSPQTKDEWFRQGHNYYNARRYQDALAAYEQTILLAPTDAAAHNSRGMALFSLARYQEALVSYNQALLLNSQFAWAYVGSGNALSKLGKYDEAMTAYENAIRLNPKLAQAHVGQGDIYYYRYIRDQRAAGAWGQPASQPSWGASAPNPSDMWGQPAQARPQMPGAWGQPVQQATPQAAWGQADSSAYGWGVPTAENQPLVLALQAYEQAIKLDPSIVEAYSGKGKVLLAQGRYAEALGAFQQAIGLDSSCAEAYHYMGDALKQLGFTKQAQEAYDKAKQLGYKG